ncbi:tetraspanin-18-like [Ostrea edulis]|uniref:tetraspanin-18-like n=1 Tax=Ostrea edulis TaxID=37623 RepID=UPI0024AFF543|nr:tetraspanin-18-like [Ostrea edulis]
MDEYEVIGVTCCTACLFLRFDTVYIKRILLSHLFPVVTDLGQIFRDTGYDVRAVIQDYDTTKVLHGMALVFLVITFAILLPVVFGISGICSNKTWLLASNIVVLGILVITQTALIITCALRADIVKGWLRSPLKMSLQTQYRGDVAMDSVSVTWNLVMIKFSCCGVDSGRDFEFSRFNRDFTLKVFNQTVLLSNLQTPLACCSSASRTTFYEPGACAKYPIQRELTHYFEGCLDKIWRYVSQYSDTLILSAVGVCALEVLQAVLACVYVECLKRDRKDQRRRSLRTYRKGSDFFFPSLAEEESEIKY